MTPTRPSSRMTPLTPSQRQIFLAAHGGDLDVLRELIGTERGDDGDVVSTLRDEAGYTPLTIAVLQGNLEVVETLIACGGADVHGVCDARDGVSPLLLACEEDEMEIVSLLLRKGADPTVPCGRAGNLLHVATVYDQQELLEWLVQVYGVPVDMPIPETGQTALMIASALHRSSCVRWLLAQGADPEHNRDHRGKTALHHAVMRSADDRISGTTESSPRGAYASLLTSLADARGVRDECGRTALHEACHRQNGPAIRILMSLPSRQVHDEKKKRKDDRMTTVDHLGRTPLFEVASSSNADLLRGVLDRMQEMHSPRELLQALHHPDAQGWTALHHAVFCGETAVVECLLEYGVRATVPLPGSRQRNLLHLVGSGFRIHRDEYAKIKDPQAWHAQYEGAMDWLLRYGKWFVLHEPVKNGWPRLVVPPLPRFGLDECFDVKPNQSTAMSALLFRKGGSKMSVLAKDKDGNLPFFLSAATGNVSEVFEQLRAAAHEGLFHSIRPLEATSRLHGEHDSSPHGKRPTAVVVTPSRPTQLLRVETVDSPSRC